MKRKADPFVARRRLRAWIDLAKPCHWARGRIWYREAHEFAIELALAYRLTVPQTVGVIAVLSVQNRWGVNKRDADSLCRAYAEGENLKKVTVATYPVQKQKAIDILESELDDRESIRELIGTRWATKTLAFFDNIISPENSRTVTIDRWVLRGLDLESVSMHPALYDRLVRVFQTEAERLNVAPCVLQATVWHVIQDVAQAENWENSRPGSGVTEPAPF